MRWFGVFAAAAATLTALAIAIAPYRLERITSLLGRSLDDPDTRQALVFAVRGHDLLHRGNR